MEQLRKCRVAHVGIRHIKKKHDKAKHHGLEIEYR